TMDADLEHDALGTRPDGTPVLLADIWPSDEEIAALVAQHVDCSLYEEGTRGLYDGDAAWAALGSEPSDTFSWDDASTYVRRAPYFDGMEREPSAPKPVEAARALALLGDFITTDHISPAGSIAADSPAARYLEERGVAPADFNTYGARRGNHEVMMRGTFANVKLQNKLAEGKKGGWTRDFATGEVRPLFDAAMDYEAAETPLVVVAGKMYGSGSSRDWAAKGPALLGIRAAFAESLGLDGSELYTVAPIDFSQGLPEPRVVDVTAERADGQTTTFRATVRVDTPTEGRYYQHGGILPFVLRSLL
ncbi:MAG: aconitate hydratase, partial [Slackia piriformis]|nr:aconitate hydratase [Slackia piriformis]